MKGAAVIAVMLVVLSAFAISAAYSSQGEMGDVDDPEMVLGTAEKPYRALTGSELDFTVGVNKSAFREYAKVLVEIGMRTSGSDFDQSQRLIDQISGEPVPEEAFCGGNKVEASIEKGADSSDEVYAIRITFGDSVGDWMYIVKVTVDDYERIGDRMHGPVEQTYCFGAHVSASESFSRTVRLSSSPSSYVALDPQSLVLPCGDPMTPAYMFVETGEGVYERDGYDFYAVGLPEGIGVKLGGEIAGKISERATEASLEGEFDVYAIEKEGVRDVNHGRFGYEMRLPEGGFAYSVNGGEFHTYLHQEYCTASDTDTVSITFRDMDDTEGTYAATCTVEGSKVALPVTVSQGGGSTELQCSTLDGHAGILQIQISKGLCTAIVHVLIVKPPVNAGLAPSVSAT